MWPSAAGTSDGLKRPALDGYAQQLALDMNRWNAALDSHKHKAEVDADVQATADIVGTPGFVIGGYYINGAQPALKFQRLIDRVLASGPAHVVRPAAPSAAQAP
jgi:predicted DsbA family dithiol-disulfide isomerase